MKQSEIMVMEEEVINEHIDDAMEDRAMKRAWKRSDDIDKNVVFATIVVLHRIEDISAFAEAYVHLFGKWRMMSSFMIYE